MPICVELGHDFIECCALWGPVGAQGDIVYNCRTCQVDPTCVQCADCFHGANHEGHDVYFHITGNGGCCDCGDVEAWSEAGFCSRHRGVRAADAATDATHSLLQGLPPAIITGFGAGLIPEALAFVADVCERIKAAYAFTPGPGDASPWHILLHNDDVHSVEEVRGECVPGIFAWALCACCVYAMCVLACVRVCVWDARV